MDDVSDERMGRTDSASGTAIGSWNCWKLCGTCCMEDVLKVSGSAEGKIPTKEGVQILWEIFWPLNI